MLRIAYCSSSKHTSVSTLLTAIKSVADAVDRPLLARARGGDGDTLQKLGLDLALFVRAGQDPREDVTHVIRATRFDPGSAFSTRSDTACELLAADEVDWASAAELWRLGADSYNSFFVCVNKAIVPKVGEKFAAVRV